MKRSPDWADKKAEKLRDMFYGGDISSGAYAGMVAMIADWDVAVARALRAAKRRGAKEEREAYIAATKLNLRDGICTQCEDNLRAAIRARGKK